MKDRSIPFSEINQMEVIKNEYHQIVISKLLNNLKYSQLRNQDKPLKVIQIFPEYIQHLNDSEFLLDIITLQVNTLKHTRIEDKKNS
jgi:hypothetical protein